MKEAILYQKLPGKKVRCGVCQRKCLIPNGQFGYCQTRINKNGKLYTAIYGVISSINNDPVEKKPVFHYKPGSFCLSLGSFGCNFRCKFCQNWEIAFANANEFKVQSARFDSARRAKFKVKAEEVIKIAGKNKSQGIAITYNEPSIWLEYSLDVFKKVKSQKSKVKSLYTVWVTNGYATSEAIDLIAPYLDIYRVDLKSFDDNFYQKLINVPKAQAIFDTTKYVHDKYPKIHLECITNIIPTWNDSSENLKKIASWIVKNLGKQTPWHVTRFFPASQAGGPCAELTNIPPTPAETLFNAREIGLKEGLEFVYIGNMEVDKEDDTFCPKCKKLVIKRDGYSTEVLGVTKEGLCQFCGYKLNITF